MIDLYPCFEHLKKFNTIWVYSDPHFNDAEMQQLRKDYIGDDEQVKKINSKLGKKDVIIFLGDIGDLEFIKKIKAGYKILVMGNHDKGKTKYQRKIEQVKVFCSHGITKEEHQLIDLYTTNHLLGKEDKEVDVKAKEIFDKYSKIEQKDNHLFDEVYTGVIMLNDKLVLSHEPINIPFMFNIHGHDHSNWEGANDELHLNACAEHISYTPINLNSLVKEGKFKNVPNIHRITIDRAINRKAKKNKGAEEPHD